MKSLSNAHVVYIITKLELGGAQKICLALMNHFYHESASSSLISGKEGLLINEANRFNSTHLLPYFHREIGLKNVISDIRAFFNIVRILRKLKKKHKTLIVHTHSTKAGLIGRWAAFFSGIPYRVHTVHGYAFHDQQSTLAWFAIYALEYLTSLITTHFVCVSDKDRSTGIKFFPHFEKKSSIIRAAVDDCYFEASTAPALIGKHPDHFTIGTISCFKPQKNIFDLLKAFHMTYEQAPQSIRRHLYLDIIGDGPLRPSIEAFILKRRLCNHVHILGWQRDIRPWLSSWQIFALSSLWEGLPCSVIEARLNHLAIVAYNVGGISEVIQDGINGFLVPPGDWQQLSQRLTALTTQPNLRTSLQHHPDELNSFSIPFMNQEHKKLYLQLTSKTL